MLVDRHVTDLRSRARGAAKQPPAERVMTLLLGNNDFAIQPGAANFKHTAEVELPSGSTLLSFFPHMHVRGKAFEYKL